MRGLVALGAVGFAAGMRSMTPLAAVSIEATAGRLRLPSTPLALLADGKVRNALILAAVGEMVADKLPITPARTIPPSLAWRVASGSIAGTALAGRENETEATGAVLGGLGALTGTFGGYQLRELLMHRLGLPNPIAGLIGDAATIALVVLATRG